MRARCIASLTFVLLLVDIALPSHRHFCHAEEGGTGHYSPGALATLIDLPPTQPGWVVQPLYLRYDGDVSRTLPIGGLVATGTDATIDAFTLGGVYTFEEKVLGAHYSVGTYLPYVWLDVEANVGTLRRSDSVDGLGDITLTPLMMAWTNKFWVYDALLSVYAPTGDYDEGDLANAGLNYWTFEPTVGIAYNNAENGFNLALHAGVTINTENDKTDYRSGSVMHVEAGIQQLLPLGPGYVSLGANGFIYEQVSGDSGSGATLGDFKGRSMGIGPALGYVLPVEENSTFLVEVRWLPELDTKNRLEGDYFWLKFAYQF